MTRNLSILLFLVIFIIPIYADDNYNTCRDNEDEIFKENIKAKIQIINTLNIPLLLKLWIVTGILVNYMQTILYAFHVYHQ